MSALDTQIGGEHYRTGTIQPVQYIEANKLAFLEGCVLKRITRHDKPTGKGRQDIEKAIHELQLLLELRYGSEPVNAGTENVFKIGEVVILKSASLVVPTGIVTEKFSSNTYAVKWGEFVSPIVYSADELERA